MPGRAASPGAVWRGVQSGTLANASRQIPGATPGRALGGSMFSDEEMKTAQQQVEERTGVHLPPGVVRVAMEVAVELAASRDGTMTAEQVRRVTDAMRTGGHGDLADALDEHIAAQGARVAVLEAEGRRLQRLAEEAHRERDEARKSADELQRQRDSSNESLEHMRERLSAAEEGNRELVRRAQQAETQVAAFSSQIQFMRTTLERAQSSEAVWRKRIEAAAEELTDVGAGEVGRLDIVTRARMLRARCATLSAAGQEQSTVADRTGEPEENAPSVDPAPEYANGLCGPRPFSSSVVCILPKGHDGEHTDGTEIEQIRYPCSDTCTHDDGAEAMRAACLNVVQRVAETLGLGPTEWEMFKSAIEGAAP